MIIYYYIIQVWWQSFPSVRLLNLVIFEMFNRNFPNNFIPSTNIMIMANTNDANKIIYWNTPILRADFQVTALVILAHRCQRPCSRGYNCKIYSKYYCTHKLLFLSNFHDGYSQQHRCHLSLCHHVSQISGWSRSMRISSTQLFWAAGNHGRASLKYLATPM